jgi:ubiquinone/menaquinone biosynthesis C-methylase UbiE
MPRNSEDAVALQRDYYSKTAAQYERMHQHEGSGDGVQLQFMIAMMRMLNVRSLLDVGTASGRTLRTLREAMPEVFVCGVDPVAALVEQAVVAGNAAGAPVLCASGDTLPFPNESFDAVCEFAVLHHVAEPSAVISEMLRVARKFVFIADSNRFGQGPRLLRLVKLALFKTGLWRTYNFIRTGGKGYMITEGDGLAYSYSVYDSFNQVAQWADRVILIPAETNKPVSWLHPLLNSAGVMVCAIRDR